MKNYTDPEILDGNKILEGVSSVIIKGPAIAFYNNAPITQQSITDVDPAALEAYVDGTSGLDSAANMEALYDKVVELSAAVIELQTILKNFGLCTS